MKKLTKAALPLTCICAMAIGYGIWDAKHSAAEASSHREAPLISNDPLADNTDLYAFRSPDDTSTVTIIANYIPFELPQGGPNFASFGTNINYEIHIKNGNPANTKPVDDITYRFVFSKVNQDSTTFFNIRNTGKDQQNLYTTYTAFKSTDGGNTFTPIVTGGIVPPPNIGPRSISGPVGLGVSDYDALITTDTETASGGGGETIYCGPADDPFFVDLGGIFDLGQTRAGGTGNAGPRFGLYHKNVHSIVIRIPITTLQFAGKTVSQASNILDANYVIGVWASASRPSVRTLNASGGGYADSGPYVQVSRLGMPLTNEAVIPIGKKDRWNSLTPYSEDTAMDAYFCNPELALYMDPTLYGGVVPAFAALKIQDSSATVLGKVSFRNNHQGLYVIRNNSAVNGTALAANAFGPYLLQPTRPRSVDLLPIFHTGVPNLAPYQLATGKTDGDPLTAGKPFINNFLVNASATPGAVGGDMLRLNMAVPVTPRNSADFSTLGIIHAAVLGLTDARFNKSSALQNIPNMDGFPNGRRLEDDVVTIELQAVGGVALAAVGLWYDDRPIGQPATSPDLLGVLGYSAGITANDTLLKTAFPYVQAPWSGFGRCGGPIDIGGVIINGISQLNIAVPAVSMMNYPNPFTNQTTFRYRLSEDSYISIDVYDMTGKLIANVVKGFKQAGNYECNFSNSNLNNGVYVANLTNGATSVQSLKILVQK